MSACDVAILGGGISGLSTAYWLQRSRPDLDITLIEPQARLGGLISTVEIDGFLFEEGPDSLVAHKPEGIQLARELGLDADLIFSSTKQAGAWLWVKGMLHPFPAGILMRAPIDLSRIGTSALLSPHGWQRAQLEPQIPPAQEPDESVHGFFARRFGCELSELLVAPLVAGVYGGDSRRISLEATFPSLSAVERDRGFVSGTPTVDATSPNPAPFVSLRRGLTQLVNALSGKLSARCRIRNGTVAEVVRVDQGYKIDLGIARGLSARLVVVATQAPVASRILSRHFPDIGGVLSEIPYAPSVIGCFGFSSDVTSHLKGTGLLVPPQEDPDLLAATWVHRKFPGRCAPGKAMVRCFLGTQAASKRLKESDSELAEALLGGLRRVTGISKEPDLVQIHRWRHGLPQYTLGHLDRIRHLDTLLDSQPGLHCVGNYFDGVGISDAIRRARATAAEIVGREAGG